MANWKATNDVTAATEARQNAALDIESGSRRAEALGYTGAANVARLNVFGGARNMDLSGGSMAQVRSSEIAIARNNQDSARYDAAHAAWGEGIKAESLTSEAGGELIGAKTAVAAGDIAAAGTVVAAAGSVAGKWTQAGQTGLFGGGTPVDQGGAGINPDSYAGRVAYSSSIYS
jgi:hypothetical protein